MKSYKGGLASGAPAEKEKMRTKFSFEIYYAITQVFSNKLARDVMKNDKGQNI